jgi:hypothetical protein
VLGQDCRHKLEEGGAAIDIELAHHTTELIQSKSVRVLVNADLDACACQEDGAREDEGFNHVEIDLLRLKVKELHRRHNEALGEGGREGGREGEERERERKRERKREKERKRERERGRGRERERRGWKGRRKGGSKSQASL